MLPDTLTIRPLALLLDAGDTLLFVDHAAIAAALLAEGEAVECGAARARDAGREARLSNRGRAQPASRRRLDDPDPCLVDRRRHRCSAGRRTAGAAARGARRVLLLAQATERARRRTHQSPQRRAAACGDLELRRQSRNDVGARRLARCLRVRDRLAPRRREQAKSRDLPARAHTPGRAGLARYLRRRPAGDRCRGRARLQACTACWSTRSTTTPTARTCRACAAWRS